MDKHKGHKQDTRHAKQDKRDEIKKRAEDKPGAKQADHEMPGAAGFRSAGAEEDTYD
ncbi:hypothetical protein PRN20_00950 [Devosia sp. ZB163]|uniref:hypothetical protein n=1 Tax=Devosia sp. ZB163 TaxID=3025938 RepID=UPI0023602710|nr:hypothetical protein [Devosia sp. ZB163]MDC9822283.1 hypothetical protein [Devosia sp. ZB163]